jgi:hypothetical protein
MSIFGTYSEPLIEMELFPHKHMTDEWFIDMCHRK